MGVGLGARGKYLKQLHTLFALSIRIQAEEMEQERKEGEEEKEKREEEEEEEEEEEGVGGGGGERRRRKRRRKRRRGWRRRRTMKKKKKKKKKLEEEEEEDDDDDDDDDEKEEEEEVPTTPEPAHLRQHAQAFRADQVQVLRHGVDKLDKGLNPDPIRHLPLLVDVVACQRPQRHGRLLLQGLGVSFLQQLHQESLSALLQHVVLHVRIVCGQAVNGLHRAFLHLLVARLAQTKHKTMLGWGSKQTKHKTMLGWGRKQTKHKQCWVWGYKQTKHKTMLGLGL